MHGMTPFISQVRHLAVAAAAALLAIALISIGARAQEPSEMMATTLQPGDNFVGWIADDAPPQVLFDAVPEIEAAYAWDPLGQRWLLASPHVPAELHTLTQLTPGMGLRVRIAGDQTVEWTRPAVPAGGIVKLHSGSNLAAWLGADDSPITHLALGIGASFSSAHVWDAAEARYLSYDPASPEGVDTFPLANRGDAVWITVDRAVNWLQPTGVQPTIEYPGGEPIVGVESSIDEALDKVLDFFTTRYGIQAAPERLTIYVAKNVEALLDALEITGYEERQSTRRLWDRWGGWATYTYDDGGARWRFVLKQEHWSVFAYPTTKSWAKCNILFHEYFHIVQYQLRGVSVGSPQWLTEGTAERMEALVGSAAGCGAYGFRYREERAKLASHSPTLRGVETRRPGSGTWEYTLGFLASDLLAQRAGDASIVEYWRRLPSTRIGPHLLWDSKPTWQSTFEDVFGIAVDAFYDEFNEWRGDLANEDYGTESQPDVSDLVISGIVVGPDDVGLSGIRVSATNSSGWHSARSARDGTFVIEVPTGSGYRIEIALSDSCWGYYAGDDADLGSYSDAAEIDVQDDGDDPITVRIPADQCLP